MSAFEWNKIIGAVLVTLLVIKVVDLAGDGLTPSHPLAKPAYSVLAATPTAAKDPAATKAAKPVAQLASIAPLLAKASMDAGKKLAKKCSTCHSLKKDGKNKVGPMLWNIVGAKQAGGKFSYSKALKKLDGNWDFEALNRFIAKPKRYAPGTKMSFAGIKKPSDRAALIAYLSSLSDQPVTLP
ncbi:MAG: c-type cytochrome [Alphaproteobacteria bacterium]|jgi:cytochrome c